MNFLFPADGQIDAMALMLGREALAEMLGPDRPPKLLNDWLENRSGLAPFANRMASTPAFASATRQLASNPYQGSSRRMFFEAKAMEGFAELLHCLSGGEAESRALALSAWERSRLFEARDLLMAHIADPPALAELARQVGLPVKRLDRLFREVFGTTPFGWVRDYRLTLAKQLLTEENLPIKQVAHRLGYSNVHNFTHAFTARFGMPPGAMRKGKKA
ncbi:MAG: helix-turn-helix domain-containing protein [Candidatus Methylumidiphilus sp.]